ncbi:Chitooligosaccharidolytic beta-N-acetylglucosaminidase [Chionoecetes opilio]|uniref:Beta-hexosaminidase n=1 Tax=Chionoecetes opilio TaxID=41210 RepID=A0A8J4YF34_CHIOP|nr:Chitooligosaccharidolytic beta-N-acetylglucosaminidase [Chionoecetes opilio]
MGRARTAVQALTVVLATNLLAAHALDDLVSSPWGWQCEFGRCVKKEIAHQEGLSTLNTCKLTCGSSGALWPIPSQVKIEDQLSLFLPNNIDFQFNCPNEVVNLMNEAGDIFKDNILRYHPEYSDGHVPWTGPWDASTESHILYVNGLVTGDAVSLNLNTDESYQLNVTTSDDFTTATIVAASFFGARHALETLSQLIEYHETSDALMVVAAQIEDSPVFPYRGILLDTSRNFVSVATLERTLDAMGASKLNTLHWHITDTHSFPLVLESLPNMAAYGAYSSRQVYTFKQVVDLKEYARVRGVRLLPELDAPAHVGNGWQWGHEAGLGDLAVCVNQEPWQEYCVEPPCGQLNLANPSMYHVLGQLYVELVKLFSPLDMFHFGGDEVNMHCWNASKEISDWMIENDFGVDEEAYFKQWAVFQQRARELFLEATGEEEIQGVLFTSGLTAAENLENYVNSSQYIIQIWTAKDDPVIKDVLTRGYKVIFSNYDAWYLDCGMGAWVGEGNNWCSPYKGWQTVYDNSPYDIAYSLTGSQHTDLILGGEATLWTEQADDATIDSKLWPRSAALAERLWSNPASGWYAAETPFVNHRQRLVKRGIQAERLQPEWCHQNEGLCYL